MSKFCMQCGAQIDDNAEICTSCGANQNAAPADGAAVKEKKSKPVLIAAVAVIIVVILLLLKALFGGSYKEPLNNMCKFMETGKGKYVYRMVPDFVIDNQLGKKKKKELIEKLDDLGENITDSLEDEYGDDIKISYQIKDKDKIDKDDLEDVEEDLEDDYDEKVNVKKGYKLKVKLKVKGDDKSDTETETLNVYKIKGKWYVLDLNDVL